MSWLLVLFGCAGQPDAPAAWIAPFDGQTAVALDFAPQLDIRLDRAEGWPLDLDLLRVANLTTGESVTGLVESDDRSIWFAADFPLAPDTDYAWSVTAPAEQPRGPSSVFPPALVGTASFSTRVSLDVAAVCAGDSADEVCVVWSRPAELGEISAWTASIDGVAAEGWALRDADDPAADRGLVGPTVSCVPRPVDGSGGTLRLTADDPSAPVVVWEISRLDPDAVVADLRRWSR